VLTNDKAQSRLLALRCRARMSAFTESTRKTLGFETPAEKFNACVLRRPVEPAALSGRIARIDWRLCLNDVVMWSRSSGDGDKISQRLSMSL
jgi:hypothetical protein